MSEDISNAMNEPIGMSEDIPNASNEPIEMSPDISNARRERPPRVRTSMNAGREPLATPPDTSAQRPPIIGGSGHPLRSRVSAPIRD